MNINIEGMLYEELLLLNSGISTPRLSVYDVEKISSYNNDKTIIIGSNENESSIKKVSTILKAISLANPLTYIYIISDIYGHYRNNTLSKLNTSFNTDRNSYIGVTSKIFKSIVMKFFGIRVYYILYRVINCLKN